MTKPTAIRLSDDDRMRLKLILGAYGEALRKAGFKPGVGAEVNTSSVIRSLIDKEFTTLLESGEIPASSVEGE